MCTPQIGLLDLKGLRRLINLFERRVRSCTREGRPPIHCAAPSVLSHVMHKCSINNDDTLDAADRHSNARCS